jgi:hypothetical protein
VTDGDRETEALTDALGDALVEPPAVDGVAQAVNATRSTTIDAAIRMNREAFAKLERPLMPAAFFLFPCVSAFRQNGYAAARRSAGTWIQR